MRCKKFPKKGTARRWGRGGRRVEGEDEDEERGLFRTFIYSRDTHHSRRNRRDKEDSDLLLRSPPASSSGFLLPSLCLFCLLFTAPASSFQQQQNNNPKSRRSRRNGRRRRSRTRRRRKKEEGKRNQGRYSTWPTLLCKEMTRTHNIVSILWDHSILDQFESPQRLHSFHWFTGCRAAPSRSPPPPPFNRLQSIVSTIWSMH